MDAVADLAERYSFGEMRVTHDAEPGAAARAQGRSLAALAGAGAVGPRDANLGLITDIIACPGLDYCALANARSIPIAQEIAERFATPARQHDIGELKIKISGCINACGHHHVGHIGILGVDKKGEEFYQITLGGSGDEDAALGKIIGPGFDGRGVVDAVETHGRAYRRAAPAPASASSTPTAASAWQPFKEAIYAAA